MKELIKFEKHERTTKITNNSGYNLVFSWKPIPPKRKIISFYLIPSGHFHVIEWELDLERISITFEVKSYVYENDTFAKHV